MSTLTPSDPMTRVVAPATPAAPAVVMPRQWLMIGNTFKMPLVTSFEEFREWRHSDECPEKGPRCSWLAGTLWIDLMTEQLYRHNQVAIAIAVVLYPLVTAGRMGRYFGDGAEYAHLASGLLTTPDGVYVSYASFQGGRVQQILSRDQTGVIRLEGAADMVLEVISPSSEEKDGVTLPALYHAAGVPEFWRVDARGELRFEILRRDDEGYQPSTLPDGWARSAAFGRDFRLTADVDPIGQPLYTLEHRPAG
ncbi:MAG: Uma2 family endonuclease [Gemmataceae bacterium]